MNVSVALTIQLTLFGLPGGDRLRNTRLNRMVDLDRRMIPFSWACRDLNVHPSALQARARRADLTRQRAIDNVLLLLRQEIARSDVTVRATLREHFLRETGHERGPAGTVYGLRRGAGRGDRACRSGGAVA